VQERAVLAPLIKVARAGQPVAARDVQIRYERLLGRTVPPATVYRLLARHQWRRVKIRPRRFRDGRSGQTVSRRDSGQNKRRAGWAPQPA